MKIKTLSTILPLTFIASLPAAQVIHYWDFDTQAAGVPVDLAGGLATTTVGSPDVSQNATYGEAYPGAGSSLNTALSGDDFLVAEVFGTAATAMIFTDSFSFSYWSYDASDLDSDARGARVFDSLAGTSTGLQLGTNLTGIFNYRMDDAANNFVLSNTTLTSLNQADGDWTHIAVNVDRDLDQAEIFFNGVSQGSYGIGGLSGIIQPSQDLQIGVINGGGAVGTAQQAGLDDLAFYDGLLSSDDLSGLASGTVTPLAIPEPGSSVLLMLGLMSGVRRRRG
jgi:hypothetical protein